jgi:hypothetical protein
MSLTPEIPLPIRQAAQAFAAVRTSAGERLDRDWLNNGPRSLTDLLPPGWTTRLTRVFTGQALMLDALGRLHLLCTKVFAFCDRDGDLADCLALAPTGDELRELRPWVAQQDAHPGWPAHVDSQLAILAERLGHGV